VTQDHPLSPPRRTLERGLQEHLRRVVQRLMPRIIIAI